MAETTSVQTQPTVGKHHIHTIGGKRSDVKRGMVIYFYTDIPENNSKTGRPHQHCLIKVMLSQNLYELPNNMLDKGPVSEALVSKS